MSEFPIRPPKISDVARLAGVSIPTVSRVLTGKTPVSEERRNRVLATIREIGYHPNGAARALVQGRQPIVAVLASNTTVYGYSLTIQGIEEAARRAGFIVVITVIESDPDSAIASAVNLVLSQPVAGVIVLDFDPSAGAVLEQIPSSMPLVAAGAAHSGQVPTAFLDVGVAAMQATDYLLLAGHRTVHHISPPASAPSGRTDGWRAALIRANAPVPDVIESPLDPESGYIAGLRIADMGGVTAVLCGNDEVAMGAISALIDRGLRVPEDVSVVGFDDLPLGRVWRPPLTTVQLDFRALGRRTFGLLAARLGVLGEVGDAPPPTLLIRGSTGPPRNT